MANLLDSVENSVWHAFECMALEGDGTVPKSKLKVGHNVIHYLFLSHGIIQEPKTLRSGVEVSIFNPEIYTCSKSRECAHAV